LFNQIYINKASDKVKSLPVPIFMQVAVALAALAVVVLGCAPDLLIERLQSAIQVAGH
jgi:NADH:ubiquinone oxidoreductase subunit 2 (subunit N)